MSILDDLFGSGKPRAERATVTFGNSTFTIDGYRLLDNGEFRAGLEGSSLLVGYAANWLSRELTRTGSKTLKTLRGMGSRGYIVEAKIVNDPGWQGSNPDNDPFAHRNPWD